MSSAMNTTVEFTSDPSTNRPVPSISVAEEALNVSSWKTQDFFSAVIPPNEVATSGTHEGIAPASSGPAALPTTTEAYPHIIPWDIIPSTSAPTAAATGVLLSLPQPRQHLSTRAKAAIITSALLVFGASCLLWYVLFRRYQPLRKIQMAGGGREGKGGNEDARTDLPRIFELDGEGARR